MAKKKSKTQKYKRNLKRKQNKVLGNITKKESNIIEINKVQKDNLKKAIEHEIDIPDNIELPRTKIVEKDKIDYNVMITYENKEKIRKENSKDLGSEIEQTKKILKDDIKKEIKEEVKSAVNKGIESPKKIVKSEDIDDITSPFIAITESKKKKKTYFELVLSRIKKNIAEYKIKKAKSKEVKQHNENVFELPKLVKKSTKPNKKVINTVNKVKKDNLYDPYEIKKEKKTTKSNNLFIRLLVDIYNNTHIIFNSIGIIIFIIMIVGLVRIKVFETSTILYIGIIVGFLLFVAISFNKYISGKVFTVIISIGMCIAIFHMQYTYDFIRNLNTGLYEYKTYYVVTFDNGVNKSIYNINNKKVGLLKDNCTNIERKLDTKIEPVYVEYEDINMLFNDFYEQNFRAILVNENQYKYLKNNIQNNRPVKILYEFIANAKK